MANKIRRLGFIRSGARKGNRTDVIEKYTGLIYVTNFNRSKACTGCADITIVLLSAITAFKLCELMRAWVWYMSPCGRLSNQSPFLTGSFSLDLAKPVNRVDDS
jgi:hypothetical protein